MLRLGGFAGSVYSSTYHLHPTSFCCLCRHILSHAYTAGIRFGRLQHLEGVTDISTVTIYWNTLLFLSGMSMQAVDQTGFNGFNLSSLRGNGPYEPSIASSASSSQASIFSDSNSVQSSIASSISDDFRHNQEDARDRVCAQAQLHCNAVLDSTKAPSLYRSEAGCPAARSYADITSLPKEQRLHPRRCALSRSQKPPNLSRQCERKISFVDNLVGKHEFHVDLTPERKLMDFAHVKILPHKWLR